jgi:hypothetical protein
MLGACAGSAAVDATSEALDATSDALIADGLATDAGVQETSDAGLSDGVNQDADGFPGGSDASLLEAGVPYDEYYTGLEKTSDAGLFTVRLLESSPIPQDTAVYTWRILVMDAAGAPVVGSEVVAEPTMPAHGHGTFPPTTIAEEQAENGRYELKDMDLFMPGIWRVEIRIEAGDATDWVEYHFDLEG